MPDNALLYGNRGSGTLLNLFSSGSLDLKNHTITVISDVTLPEGGGGVILDPNTPQPVGASGVVGTSGSASHGNHVHQGVVGLYNTPNAIQSGVIDFEGSGNITVTQSSGSFTIGTSGSFVPVVHDINGVYHSSFPLSSANGGTGVNNGSNALTVPATGTAALLGTSNIFTAANQFYGGASRPQIKMGFSATDYLSVDSYPSDSRGSVVTLDVTGSSVPLLAINARTLQYGDFSLPNIALNSLLKTDGTTYHKVTAITNATGYLFNNGSGAFSYNSGDNVFDTGTPADVGASAVAGTSGSVPHQDHVHRGVTGIYTAPNTNVYGSIALVGSSNITVAQSSGSFTFGTSGTFPATAHNILSATHGDSVAASPTRGDLVTAQGVSPAWTRLGRPVAKNFLTSDGTDVIWSSGSIDLSSTSLFTLETGVSVVGITSGSFALGAGPLSSTSPNDISSGSHTHQIIPSPALVGNGTAAGQVLFTSGLSFTPGYSSFLLGGATGGKTNLNVSNTKTLTLTATDNYTLTIAGAASISGTNTGDQTLTHNILSATHLDSTAASLVRGDILTAQGVSPLLSRLAISVPAAGGLNVLGVANGDTEPAYKTVLDATNPVTLTVSTAAAPGTALIFAHRDHAHAVTSSSAPGVAASLLATDSSGNLTIAGTLAASGTTDSTTTNTGVLQSAGGLGVAKNLVIPTTSGTTGYGLKFYSGANGLVAAFQALDLVGDSYLFYTTNRYYDGTNWQQLNTRVGAALEIAKDELDYYTFPASSSVGTQRLHLSNAGVMTLYTGGLIIGGTTTGAASSTSFTNVTNATVTNAYVVKGGQAANTVNTGWIKIFVGTTTAWVPYYANATP